MRLYGLKYGSTEGTFSLLNAQLNIGTVSQRDGKILKGFAIESPNFLRGPLIQMTRKQASNFIACLRQVERKELPVKYRIRFGLWNLSAVTFTFKQYDAKWYGSGGVKGSLSIVILPIVRWEVIEISMDAVSKLASCLESLFE